MKPYIFILILALVSCKDTPTPEAVAVQTAKAYYDQLLHGEYAAFVSGTIGNDSLPASYREQLETNMKMFVANQKAEHGGIDSVCAVRAKVDTLKLQGGQNRIVADAILTLCYKDSTKEQIVVPMILNNELWLMR